MSARDYPGTMSACFVNAPGGQELEAWRILKEVALHRALFPEKVSVKLSPLTKHLVEAQ